ncbi:SCO family protein [Pelagerythrobacter rhizovicinus]|uniref:SCO family protein n=1 Tax=Pelagerythrobacter rhizovicinus TaxID=2268576 RepID=A0A4Q2KMA5_9SPHN|nr:SCO family protein [Pelagerythrobacter rhizovicinus]RXZ65567.1 SCO family protein [Pelagerythrobacter rhizovicinus]
MKRRAMPLPRTLIALSAALALAACDSQPALETAPLRGAAIGGPFALTGGDGKVHRWADYDGKWRIVYFGYTYCPDICPTDVQRFSQGLTQFEKAEPELGAQVQPIFITIDPARDTPEVVAEFVSNFHPRLVGLTGTPEQIEAVAKTFGVFFSRGREGEGGAYDMNHSNVVYLFAPDGSPVAILPANEGADAIAAELARWVR